MKRKIKKSKYPMYKWAKDLFPFNRSITGEGVRKTLKYIKNILPELKIISEKTGSKFFDWKIPKEWKVKNAYIKNLKGKTLVNFKDNNLHLLGYSRPIRKQMTFKTLSKKLYTLPKQPNFIPYRTSYYKNDWGFCLSHNHLKKFNKKDNYYVEIDSKLFNGILNYGEIYIKGKTKKEILFSTNICHPSLANNEISGPVLSMQIAKFIKS